MVFPTATQTEDAHAIIDHQLIIDTVAALRRTVLVAAVVIAVDVQKACSSQNLRSFGKKSSGGMMEPPQPWIGSRTKAATCPVVDSLMKVS